MATIHEVKHEYCNSSKSLSAICRELAFDYTEANQTKKKENWMRGATRAPIELIAELAPKITDERKQVILKHLSEELKDIDQHIVDETIDTISEVGKLGEALTKQAHTLVMKVNESLKNDDITMSELKAAAGINTQLRAAYFPSKSGDINISNINGQLNTDKLTLFKTRKVEEI